MALPKTKRLTGSGVKKVFNAGKSYRSPHLIFKVLNEPALETLIAVVVPVKIVKKASARNKIRRKVQGEIRKLAVQSGTGKALVVTVTTPDLPEGSELNRELLTLWEKSGMLRQ